MAGRNIGVAVDFSSCSKAALRWASTNLTRSGDKLILIHVKSSYQNEQGAVHLWEQSGSCEWSCLFSILVCFEFDSMCLMWSCLLIMLVYSGVFSALIPLAEFSDVTKTYSVSPDKETIEILTQVANQRGVRIISHFICTFPVLNSWFFSPSLEVALLISWLLSCWICMATDWSLCKDTLRRPCKEAVRSSWPGSPQLHGYRE